MRTVRRDIDRLFDDVNGQFKEIEGLGVTVTRLSDAEIKAFRDATRAVYDKWKPRVGNDLVATAEKAVSARSS